MRRYLSLFMLMVAVCILSVGTSFAASLGNAFSWTSLAPLAKTAALSPNRTIIRSNYINVNGQVFEVMDTGLGMHVVHELNHAAFPQESEPIDVIVPPAAQDRFLMMSDDATLFTMLPNLSFTTAVTPVLSSRVL